MYLQKQNNPWSRLYAQAELAHLRPELNETRSGPCHDCPALLARVMRQVKIEFRLWESAA